MGEKPDPTGFSGFSDAPWEHRGHGVIVNAKKRVLGAFENARHAEAAVAAVNYLAAQKPGGPDRG